MINGRPDITGGQTSEVGVPCIGKGGKVIIDGQMSSGGKHSIRILHIVAPKFRQCQSDGMDGYCDGIRAVRCINQPL